MAELSRQGTVRSIEGSTQDLTGTYDATSSRLADARTRRRAIVAKLATASGAEADRLRTRLATATAEVERLGRRQRDLRARTTYATVDLTVIGARSGAVTPPADGPWTPADAWRDARRGLEVAAGSSSWSRASRSRRRCSRGSPCGCGGAGANTVLD